MDTVITPTPTATTRQIADLPGPRPWPLVGNAHGFKLHAVHQVLEQWARQYGPIFKVKFGPRTVVVVADHEASGQVLRTRPDGFRRSSRLEVAARDMGMSMGLFGAEGEAWRNQRRMVMASFAPGHVKAYFPALLKVAQRLQGRWRQAAQQGTAIALQADLMRFTVDAITGLAFGADVNTLESDEDVIQRHLDQIFPALFRRIFAQVPYWRYIKLPRDRQLDRSVAEVNVAITGFIAQARSRLQADPARREAPPNLLEAMIVAADEAGSGVDDRDVAGNVLTMLLAGEDTTANTLAWMIYLLTRHPQALQRAQQEVWRVVGPGANEVAGFTPEKMAALDYIEACANEAMRLKPVAPFLPVEALQDTVVGDVQVPQGTLVMNLLRHDSVSDAHFPDPLAFKPERWLEGGDPHGHATTQASSAKRVAMPFGSGPRICPGRYLALLEIKLAMATLLSGFEIAAVDTPDGGDAQEWMAFTMGPLGLTMRLRART
jgi:cytochrome P450